MYTSENFKTKKALKEAVKEGRKIAVFQPSPFGGNPPKDGDVVLEGPHYPEPHRWYATAKLKDGFITSVS